MARIHPGILGRWRIIEIDGNDPNDAGSDVPAFIKFDEGGVVEFAFGLVEGFIDHRLLVRDGKPAVEWTWEGNDEMEEVCGLGWAVVDNDQLTRGKIFFHQGPEMNFAAMKFGARKTKPLIKSAASKATRRQGQFLAFIHLYTKLNGRPPAEADMQLHFRVSPPSVHQMVMTLEKRGHITRTPGAARSIRLVPTDQLPELG